MNLKAKFKGWYGEKKTAFQVWYSLNSRDYRKYHNVILPSKNGTSQIDHLIISRFGLFIIETKHREGWIFGSERGSVWTQTLYKQKYQFQNPLHQAYRQKMVLSQFLDVAEKNVFPIVYFNGNCTFKTALPNNVLRSGVLKYKRISKSVIPQ